MWIVQVLVLFVSLSATLAFGGIGSCPTPKVMEGFELDKLSGTWYIIEASAGVDKLAKKCNRYIIEKKERKHASLLHKYISTVTNKWKSEYSDISTPKSKEPAKLLISPLKGTVLARKYDVWIIDTDYDSYAISYTCSKRLMSYSEEINLLSRTPEMEDTAKTKLYDILRKRDLNQKNLVAIAQGEKDCSTD